MKDILTKLSSKYGCDKSDKNHLYTKIYNNIFENYRNEKFNMIEFGFGLGKSVKMWLEYFTKVKLITVDIRKLIDDLTIKRYIKKGRLEYIKSSQIDKENIIPILKKYKKFFVIIDDASHVAEDQQYTLGFAFKYVSKGGWYIIEDLKCRRNHNKLFDIEAEKTIDILTKYNETKEFKSLVLTDEQNKYINENIEYIDIYEKIAFIKKKG